jgi:competence protein ComEA
MRFLAVILLFVSFLFAKVDINSASEAELQKVKGIGAAKAKAIVEYRKKNGNFTSVDDLTKVKGFAAKSVAALKGDVEVTTALTNPPAKK